MKIYLHIALIVCGILSAASFCLGAFVASPGKGTGDNKITTVQKWGEKISVSNWNTSGSTIKFTTTAEGAGVSETIAPKTIVPEARAYIEDRNCMFVLGGTLVYDRKCDPFAGAEYLRRFGSAFAGGGAFISRGGIIGLYGKVGWMF